MPRETPKRIRRPFYTSHSLIAKALADSTVLPSGDSAPTSQERDAVTGRDWVDEEEDAFIERHPNKRCQRDIGARHQITLATQRITTKSHEGEMSSADFETWLHDRSEGDSVVDLLRRQNVFRENRYDPRVTDCERTLCPVELHVFYVTHRWTPVDDLREHSQSADGIDSLVRMAEQCRVLAQNLRTCVAPLAESAPVNHEMPDSMRRALMRAAGTVEPEAHRGHLDYLAAWIDEAAARFDTCECDHMRTVHDGGCASCSCQAFEKVAPLRRRKEAAFMREWDRLACARCGDPLYAVGHRIFALAFGTNHVSEESYARAVRRLRA